MLNAFSLYMYWKIQLFNVKVSNIAEILVAYLLMHICMTTYRDAQ